MGKKGGAATKATAKGGRGKSAAAQQAKRDEMIAAWKKRQQTANAAQREESEFTRLDPVTLERLNVHATYDFFPRPIPGRITAFEHEAYEYEFGTPEAQQAAPDGAVPTGLSRRQQQQRLLPRLQLPKKPKWNRDMSTKAVQSNEKEAFRSWLEQTDQQVAEFFLQGQGYEDDEGDGEEQQAQGGASAFLDAINRTNGGGSEDEVPPNEKRARQLCAAKARREAAKDPYRARMPTQYERNLFVYQQLWRVVDRSHILLVLMDVRAAHLHLPPSLQAYLQRRTHNRVRRTILVLTKTDLVTPRITQDWVDYLMRKFPHWSVVPTSSYLKLAPLEGQGQRTRLQPYISDDSHARLMNAIQREYETLLQQPTGSEDQAESDLGKVDFDRLRRGVISEQDLALSAAGAKQGPAPESDRIAGEGNVSTLPTDLVIGCVGQPNVGKSSLINALLGGRKVHASKTPGKTKHYQTLVLASRPPHPSGKALSEAQLRAGDPEYSRVVLCDSPGLVFPMFAGLEMQVLAGVYNVAHVQAPSAAVQYAGERIPLEHVYRLTGPVEDSDTLRGMRTRKPDPRQDCTNNATPWSAGLFLEAVAQARGFRTAKAARLDTNRAANWVLRALAEGRVHWAFRPPPADGQSLPDFEDGIWLRDLDAAAEKEEQVASEAEEEDDPNEKQAASGTEESKTQLGHTSHPQPQPPEAEDTDEEPMPSKKFEDSDEEPVSATTVSRFAALQIDGDESD